jgi:hypothetical protein
MEVEENIGIGCLGKEGRISSVTFLSPLNKKNLTGLFFCFTLTYTEEFTG